MSEETTEKAADKPKPTVDELRAGIEQTRAELGETVQALAAQADVKARAMDQVEQARQRVLGVADQAQVRVRASGLPLSIVLAGLAAAVGVILIVRGSRR